MADQDIIPATSAARLQMGGPLEPVRSFMRQPAVAKSLPLIGLLAALAITAAAWWSFHTPPQRPLFEGLAEADKSAVASSLQSAGIDYTLDGGSGAISVGDQDFHRARMLLAGQGLPKAAPTGDALVSAIPMGASRAVEGQTLKAAREADLARTIEAIDSVATARVHLATPEPSLFVRDNAEPAASVMLRLQTGRSLSDSQVRAIRHLVASSVPGLNAEQVSIIDQSGALLSQQGANGDDRNFQLQTQMEDRYRQAIITLLTPVMGAGNFSTEVHAELDLTESQATRETYPKDDVALRREEGNKTSGNSPAPAIGIPGAVSNTPPPATQVANTPGGAQATPNPAPAAGAPQVEEQYSRSFDVGREISVTHQPTGRLKRVTVAVALNAAKPLKPAELQQIDALVKGAVGFDQQRGDNVAVSVRPFAKEPVAEKSLIDEPWLMPLAQQGGALIGALLAFLFIGRPIMKAFKSKAEAPAEIDENLATQLLSATSHPSPGQPVTLAMIESAPSYEARAALVRTFVQQDPKRAALVVRQLMQEPAQNG
jgi:flagellar M-ring protein FliF